MDKQCMVLFPVYKPLAAGEKEIIRHALEMTAGFSAAFVAPESLVFDGSFGGFEALPVERFADEFFAGIPGYNRLMLDRGFYERFRGFDYILIHQTDAYIFSPDLGYWCGRGWDYIGAPWFKEKKLPQYRFWQAVFRSSGALSRCKPVLRQALNNSVGNGGLSLRRVDSFIRVLERADPRILALYRENRSNIFNEDVFWGLQAPLICPDFKVPGWREAMRFAVERSPSRCCEIMGGLPFGCHAFGRIEPGFWRRFIPAED